MVYNAKSLKYWCAAYAVLLLLAQLYYALSGLFIVVGFVSIVLCLGLAVLFFPIGQSNIKNLRNVFLLLSMLFVLSANHVLTSSTAKVLLLQIVMFSYPISLLNMPMSVNCDKTEKILGKTFVFLLISFVLLYAFGHLSLGEDGIVRFLNMGCSITLFKSLFFLSFFWLISRKRKLLWVSLIAGFNLLIGERTAALTIVDIYIV